MRILLLLLMLPLFSWNCKFRKKTAAKGTVFSPVFAPGPAIIVYKTRGNYNQLVPVILNKEKTAIVQYPAPSDVKDGEGFVYPIRLRNGYLLDVKGITEDVAFLEMSMKDYAALDKVPELTALYTMIKDKNPLQEMCDCGLKSAQVETEMLINRLIKDGELNEICKKIK